MKAQAKKAGAKRRTAHRPTQTAPLTRMIVFDALRTWVLPALAIGIGLVVFVLYNVDLVDEAVAVTTIGALALLVLLFFGLRSFAEQRVDATLGVVLITFAVLWSATTFYPFYRARNPGTPVFSAKLSRNGGPAIVPLQGKPGHYNMMVSGHFTPVEGRQNRTATYHIMLGDGTTDRLLEGIFNEEWRSQRIGTGRRSSVVPVKSQTTQVPVAVDDPEGRNLTLTLKDLSPTVGDTVTVDFYKEIVPLPVLIALGVLSLAGASLVDAYRPKGAGEGLMGTLTVATLVAIVVFRASSAAAPGFPQLVVATLLGTLAGAIGGSILWRLTLQLKKRVPALH